jgi:hypothetical protein
LSGGSNLSGSSNAGNGSGGKRGKKRKANKENAIMAESVDDLVRFYENPISRGNLKDKFVSCFYGLNFIQNLRWRKRFNSLGHHY